MIGARDFVQDLVLQPDGKIVILGYLDVRGGVGHWNIRRFDADGSSDANFNTTSNLSGPFLSEVDYAYGYHIALGTGGKIVVSGAFTEIDGVVRPNIARLHENGALDTSFTPPALDVGSGDMPRIFATTSQSDGKILIAGNFTLINGIPRSYLARLNDDGSFDSSFDAKLDGNASDRGASITGLTLDSDGSILIRGLGIATVQGSPASSILRLNPDGSLRDATVATQELRQAVKYSRRSFGLWNDYFAVDANDRMLTETLDPDWGVKRLVRWTTKETLDDGFNFIPDAGPRNSVYAIAIQPDGNLLAAGEGGLVRLFGGEAIPVSPVMVKEPRNLTADEYASSEFSAISYGYPKPTYQWRYKGKILPGENKPIFRLFDTQIFDAGEYSLVISNELGIIESRSAILTVRPSKADASPSTKPGAPDLSFSPETTFTTCGFCLEQTVNRGLLVQKDDKILVAGTGLRRLHPNGQTDGRFNAGLDTRAPSIEPLVTDMVLQNDGRILMCGNFTNVHGIHRNGMARLLPDGALDETFDAGEGFLAGSISGIALQNDEKILIAGSFASVGGVTRSGLARLDASGRLDTQFDAQLPAFSKVQSILVQSDGAVLISGSFTKIGESGRPGLARLLPDGHLDPDFQPALGNQASPRLLALQSDGKIWIQGNFGASTNLVRLNANGTTDRFGGWPTRESLSSPLALVVQPNGKILVSARRGITGRLNEDGSMDDTFVRTQFRDSGSIAGGQFLALQSDGRVVVAGEFTNLTTADGDKNSPGLARLFNDREFFLPTFVPGFMRPLPGGVISFRISAFPGTQVVTEMADRFAAPEWIPLNTNNVEWSPVTVTVTNTSSVERRLYRLVTP